jgi:glycosyltransferase involved in cell wall biosynthesis
VKTNCSREDFANIPFLLELPPPVPNKTGWPWIGKVSQIPQFMPDGRPWPRISIVTPSYNQSQYLEETIRSVLLQGYPNLEYFVIDGGSTDNSVEIIKKYEPWLTYWESEKDRGQCHAINKGFARATGQILAWLNSDDVYYPGALASAAQSLARREKSLLVGASIITDGPNQLSGSYDKRQPTWAEMLYDARTFPQPSVFWTRDLWAVAGPLDEELYFVMDFDLWLRMHPHARAILFLEQVLSYARTHSQQKSADPGFDLFSKQRVCVCVRAAKMYGEHQLLWLFKVWSRRIWQAHCRKSYIMLRGSYFHQASLRIVLFGESHPET